MGDTAVTYQADGTTETKMAKANRINLTRSIVFIGLMGAGKSKIGRQISQDFGLDFIDSDAVIENVAGMDIPSIFELYGEAKFREIEAREIQNILDGKPAIVSTGGGAYMNDQSRKIINEKSLCVWLKAKPETLVGRISNTDSRPLLRDGDPMTVMKSLAETREPVYQNAELTINTDGLSLPKAIEKVKLGIISYLDAETA